MASEVKLKLVSFAIIIRSETLVMLALSHVSSPGGTQTRIGTFETLCAILIELDYILEEYRLLHGYEEGEVLMRSLQAAPDDYSEDVWIAIPLDGAPVRFWRIELF